jgi:hypothetical protein
VSAYYQRSFAERFGAMGDKAEAAFTQVNPTAHRVGLCRPAFSLRDVDANLRYAPDYMTPDGFVEVMGFSSRGSGTLKLKYEKADALRAWNMLAPVSMFVFDSGGKRYWIAPINDWLAACYKHATHQRFEDDDRPYFDLPYPYFPSQPQAMP